MLLKSMCFYLFIYAYEWCCMLPCKKKYIFFSRKESHPAVEKTLVKPSQMAKAKEVRKVTLTPKTKEVAKVSRTSQSNATMNKDIKEKGKLAVKANPATKVASKV